MAGLDDLNSSIPDGKSLLSGGDNAIRLVITKLLEFAAIEHALTGEHKFGKGTIAQRPAFGHVGRFYILTTAGVPAELQYDTGSAWATLTSNEAVVNYANGLATHAAAAILAHPDGSVTAAKIKAGAVLKKHLDGGTDGTSLASLVGGAVTNLHTHGADVGANGYLTFNTPGDYTVTFPPGVKRMYFTMAGGGGAGGAGYLYNGLDGNGGGGGAAGTVVWNYPIAREPGTILDLRVGIGGLGSDNYNARGASGGDSWAVGPTDIIAAGGQGGAGAFFSPVSPDVRGGTALNGMVPSGDGGSIIGEDGGDTAWYDGGESKGSAGGGGASFFGEGGKAAGDVGPLYPGTLPQYQHGMPGGPAAGGGGGGGSTGASISFGGNGGDGLIIVTW